MLNNRFVIKFIFSFFLVSSLFSAINENYDLKKDRAKEFDQFKPNITPPYGYFNPTPPY